MNSVIYVVFGVNNPNVTMLKIFEEDLENDTITLIGSAYKHKRDSIRELFRFIEEDLANDDVYFDSQDPTSRHNFDKINGQFYYNVSKKSIIKELQSLDKKDQKRLKVIGIKEKQKRNNKKNQRRKEERLIQSILEEQKKKEERERLRQAKIIEQIKITELNRQKYQEEQRKLDEETTVLQAKIKAKEEEKLRKQKLKEKEKKRKELEYKKLVEERKAAGKNCRFDRTYTICSSPNTIMQAYLEYCRQKSFYIDNNEGNDYFY